MQPRTLKVERLGRVEYGAALELQKQTERAVLTDEQPDTLLLLEHPHTLTRGRRATANGIMASEDVLRKRGVTVFETNRGGKVTYHGLGQIVGYPIINLSPDREDVHRFVRDLEEVLLRTMNDFDIESFRIDGLTGVQRVFFGWAQVWRTKSREAEAIRRLAIDPHSPPEFRCNGVIRNLDAYYDAFDVGESDGLYLEPQHRVRIWS